MDRAFAMAGARSWASPTFSYAYMRRSSRERSWSPGTFDDGVRRHGPGIEWVKIAEEMERGLKAYGHVVMRVQIDPKTFPDWCDAHGTSPGREGRKRFVAAAVTERYGNQI